MKDHQAPSASDLSKNDQKLKRHLLRKKITGIRVYNINPVYHEFDPERQWVFDGGLLLEMGNDSVFLGWNMEVECFDLAYENARASFYQDTEYYDVGITNIHGFSQLIGQEITHIEAQWDFYQKYDDNIQVLPEKHFVPLELILQFSNHSFLQIAILDYEFEEDPIRITQAQLEFSGEMLVSLNERVEMGTDMDRSFTFGGLS